MYYVQYNKMRGIVTSLFPKLFYKSHLNYVYFQITALTRYHEPILEGFLADSTSSESSWYISIVDCSKCNSSICLP